MTNQNLPEFPRIENYFEKLLSVLPSQDIIPAQLLPRFQIYVQLIYSINYQG